MNDTDITAQMATCQALLAASSAEQVVACLLQAVSTQMQVDRLLVLLRDTKLDKLSPRGAHGFTTGTPEAMAEPFAQHVAMHRRTLRLSAEDLHPLWQHRDPQAQNILCLPMVRGNNLVGIVYIDRAHGDNRFSEAQQTQLEMLIAPAAAALENLTVMQHVRDLEHDMRNALGAANLLLFQLIGSEVPNADSMVTSVRESDNTELHTLATFAQAMSDGAQRETYLAHVKQLESNHQIAAELLTGVRAAINRALSITTGIEGKPPQGVGRFALKPSQPRSSR